VARNATPADYLWAESGPFEALCLTLVQGEASLDALFRAAGHAWEESPRSRFDRVLDLVDGFDFDREPVLVDRLGGWWILVAPNGYELSLPGAAAGASRVGRLVSVFWNVNAVMQFVVAEAGRIKRRFDPLLTDDSEGETLAEEAGLPFGDPEAPLRAAALALAERLTGVALSEAWLLHEHDVAVLRRRAWAPDDPGSAAVAPLARGPSGRGGVRTRD
jgi:hypothetical protein